MTGSNDLGLEMHALMTKAFPICRSITGDGVRQTLGLISEILPLMIYEVPSGTPVFDWRVPREWNIRDAYVANEQGQRVIDFRANNLHVVGYSVPVDTWLILEDLQRHLYSLPEKPDAIPFVTSYYSERWGFCLTHNERMSLPNGRYHVVIDSDLKDGALTYGECIIPGELSREVFLSTYVCHPSMANNELSGPVIATYLGRWLKTRSRRYTYRIAFVTETIGAITYISRNLDALKTNVEVGFNLTCLGDELGYSYVASRYGKTLADRVAQNVLNHGYPGHIAYSFLSRGSDERQYCSPGVDLPLVTLCRSKFGEYPQYHTSLDDLSFVTPDGLAGGFSYVRQCIETVERNRTYRVNCLGEPQLGKRGFYPSLSTHSTNQQVHTMLDVLAYSDGTNDLIDISDRTKVSVSDIADIADQLAAAGLLEGA